MNKQIFNNLDDFKFWVETLKHQGKFSKIAFDTELENGLIWDKMKLQGISFCNGEDACYFDVSSIDVPTTYFNQVFQSIDKLVAHNLPYDLKVLQRCNIISSREITHKVFDTMTAAHLLDENGPKGLKDLAIIYDLAKPDEVKSWKEISRYSPNSVQFCNYALNDVIWTWQLHEILGSKLVHQGMKRLFFEIEMPFQFVLVEMETNGITLDLSKLQELRKKMFNLKRDYEGQMLALLGKQHVVQKNLFEDAEYISPVNFSSSHQLIKIIEGLGLKLPFETDTGQKSVDKATLLHLSGQHPFIDLLKNYRIAEKLLNGFLDKLPNHLCLDGKIRASFNNTGAVTGRLSSSNPNCQQIPKNKKAVGASVRGCFIASPGKKLIVGDYSGQELRVLTQVTRDPGLVECHCKGGDIHLAATNKCLKLEIPKECLFSSHPKYESYKSKYKDSRDKIKNKVVFPIIYGTTAIGVSKSLGISEELAQSYIDSFFELYPKVKQCWFDTIKEVKTKGFVTNLAGRRHRFDEPCGYAYRQAFNFKVQGFSADMIRLAAILILNEIRNRPEWDMRFLLIVHDEVVLEVNERFTDEAVKLIKSCMENAVKFCIPVIADVGSGLDYASSKP